MSTQAGLVFEEPKSEDSNRIIHPPAEVMSILEKLPRIKEVRGQGLLVGIEFKEPIAIDVKHGCFDKKLLVTAIGDNIIRMVPPLILTKEDCDKAVAIIEKAIVEL